MAGPRTKEKELLSMKSRFDPADSSLAVLGDVSPEVGSPIWLGEPRFVLTDCSWVLKARIRSAAASRA